MRPPEGEKRELLPHFLPVEGSPRPPGKVGEILLASGRPRTTPDGPVWPLRGSFRVANPGGSQESILRRLVIAITSDASHVTRARHALLDAALFGPDVKAGPSEIAGFFSLDLVQLFELENRMETFHLVASIGADTSDVLTCRVELPWIDPPRPAPIPPAGAGEEEVEDEEDEEDEEPDDQEEDDDEDDDSWMIDEKPLTDF